MQRDRYIAVDCQPILRLCAGDTFNPQIRAELLPKHVFVHPAPLGMAVENIPSADHSPVSHLPKGIHIIRCQSGIGKDAPLIAVRAHQHLHEARHQKRAAQTGVLYAIDAAIRLFSST